MRHQHHAPSWRWLGVVLPLILGLVGCDSTDDPAGPGATEDPVPASLELAPNEVDLLVGSTSILSTRVRSGTGTVLPNDNVTFQSRDSTTVRALAGGEILGVAGGETWIVAQLGTLQDSVHVTTHYPVVEGQAKARILGDEDYEVEWVTDSYFLDLMGTEEGDRFNLALTSTASVDTGIVVILAQEPQEGRHEFLPLSIEEFLDGGYYSPTGEATAFFFTETPEEIRVYVGVEDSFLDLETVTPAKGPGASGSVAGRLVMKAVGYRLFAGAWTNEFSAYPTGDTLTIYADLAASCLHWGVGQATVTLEGGPASGIYTGVEAWLSDQSWSSPGSYSISLEMEDIYADIYTPYPEVGQFSLDSLGIDGWYGTTGRSVFLENWNWGQDWEYAWNTDGTLTIEDVVPSDGEVWGQVKGTMSANLAYTQSWSAPPSDAGSIAVEFHAVQIPTQAWMPPQLVEAQERGRWFPPFPMPKNRETRNEPR